MTLLVVPIIFSDQTLRVKKPSFGTRTFPRPLKLDEGM